MDLRMDPAPSPRSIRRAVPWTLRAPGRSPTAPEVAKQGPAVFQRYYHFAVVLSRLRRRSTA